MATVYDIFSFMNELAPTERKMDFDNVGLLVGHRDREVKTILTALDITDAVIREASELGADVIVAHHPLFFETKRVTDEDGVGRKILALAENGIAAISMHTNLDAAEGGVNDALGEALGLKNLQLLHTDGIDPEGRPYGIGRVGELDGEMCLADFLAVVKHRLNAPGLRYVDGGKTVHRVAVLGGSGGGELDEALRAGCDTFLTADVKHHVWLSAREEGINLIDGGHFSTENTVVPVFTDALKRRFAGITVVSSAVHSAVESFFVG